jgi:2-polyprenyl-6-methoxyphenol hydroxylase-like FAD-dependent oxidoreductase
MTHRLDTEVLIVGGGPVGLTLGMDLARRGVAVTLAERRRFDEPPRGRCNVVSARTMEAFRRLGIVAAVRGSGLPAHYPNDVAIRTRATGFELARIRIPCRAERYTAQNGPDTWWPTPEPPHRVNQIYLEPVLRAAAAQIARLRLLDATSVFEFEERANGVLARACDHDSGSTHEIFARYLVGCDGAHSQVRRGIGVALGGDGLVIHAQTTYIRSAELLARMPGPAWAIDCLSPQARGLMFAIDGRERWVVHKFAGPGEQLPKNRERSIREILGVDSSFGIEIVGQEDWTGRRLIAQRFRQGRVFLCGDAAHVWAPFAAYGMNAGIADAVDLSWMLAAVIHGWAEPALLDAYTLERRPVCEAISQHAARLASAWTRRYGSVPDTIDEPGAAADALRERLGRQAHAIAVNSCCCGGLNFGYAYEGSPVIAHDGESPPAYTLYDFRQSTVPGCRTPHLWLRDGRSLYDAVGTQFTLLRLDRRVAVDELSAAATARGVPLEVLDLDAAEAAALYPCKLLLSRPDLHVAWRGDRLPEDPFVLIDRVRGA